MMVQSSGCCELNQPVPSSDRGSPSPPQIRRLEKDFADTSASGMERWGGRWCSPVVRLVSLPGGF